MAKAPSNRNDTPTSSSSRRPTAVLVVGGLLVAGLVGWALTRSVEPAPVQPTATYAPPPPASATPDTSTAPPAGTATATSTLSPRDFSIPATPQDPDKAVVARISAEDLYGRFTRGDVTIIDVRDADSYKAGHIPGSLHVPMASIQTQLDRLRTGKPVVAYCT